MTQLDHAPNPATAIRVEVRPSAIHGLGLFAASPIPEDTHIGDYDGPVVFEEHQDGDYVLWTTDDEGNLFGIDGQNELRYVNHSLKPNAVFYDHQLYALRDIHPGEEITHHYGDDWTDTN